MDFRIIEIDGYQILLERIEGETGMWEVILSVYLDLTKRYDDWYQCVDPESARQVIAAITQDQAQDFLHIAKEWALSGAKVRRLQDLIHRSPSAH